MDKTRGLLRDPEIFLRVVGRGGGQGGGGGGGVACVYLFFCSIL